jgi:hypothetical protein
VREDQGQDEIVTDLANNKTQCVFVCIRAVRFVFYRVDFDVKSIVSVHLVRVLLSQADADNKDLDGHLGVCSWGDRQFGCVFVPLEIKVLVQVHFSFADVVPDLESENSFVVTFHIYYFRELVNSGLVREHRHIYKLLSKNWTRIELDVVHHLNLDNLGVFSFSLAPLDVVPLCGSSPVRFWVLGADPSILAQRVLSSAELFTGRGHELDRGEVFSC